MTALLEIAVSSVRSSIEGKQLSPFSFMCSASVRRTWRVVPFGGP